MRISLPCILCLLLLSASPARAEDEGSLNLFSFLKDAYKTADAGPFSSLARLLSLLPPPLQKQNAEIKSAPAPVPEMETPMIAIVIDDMGVDRKRSAEALKLPAAITMSYLPYSLKIREQTAEAKAAGHELLVHVPMEPERKTADPGPDYLGVDFPPEEIRKRVVKNLSAFDGYVGINNHMGSKFTCCAPDGLKVVMEELKSRGLLFLDSKTLASSIAEKTAREQGVPTAHRDVFLDDEEKDSFTEDALRQVERFARRNGSVIAIGHPRDITLKALHTWLPTLKDKGFRLVPLTEVFQYRITHPGKVAANAAH